MKKLLALLIFIPSLALADTNITVPRNAAATIQFELRDAEGATPGLDLEASAVCATGDVTIVEDGAAPANSTNCFVDEGSSYSLVLAAGDVDGKVTTIHIVDQTGTKVWVDKVINVYTYGDSSAFHAVPAVNVTQWSGTNVASPATAGYPAVTIKDGTGTGEIDTNAGAVVAVTTATTCTTASTCSALAANSITASVIATDAIGASEIAADAIGASELATDAIGAAELAAGAITTAEIATGAIDADATASDFLAEINAEVVDVIRVDTLAELTDIPAATTTLANKITHIFMQFRNAQESEKTNPTAATKRVFQDDGTTVYGEQDVTDDATTYEQGEMVDP